MAISSALVARCEREREYEMQVIPLENLVSAVSETLKEAGAKNAKAIAAFQDKAAAGAFPTEAPLLELLHGCVRQLQRSQLQAAWPSLHSLLADAPLAHLPSRAVFLLFIILCDYVKLCAPCSNPLEDKGKLIGRQLQQVSISLVEALNAIVGWQLEQTTWLKRTLVVKQDQTASSSGMNSSGVSFSSSMRSQENTPSLEGAPLQGPLSSSDASNRASSLSLAPFKSGSSSSAVNSSSAAPGDTQSLHLSSIRSNSNLRASIKDSNNNKRDPAESTRALFLLAQNLAELVDCVCRSEEKDKLLPVLNAVWANVVPYLKAKNARNARFFLASSQLLATMSSFAYMRPVWRKTTMELLSDPSFFKMDQQSLRQWLIVADHLMTQDKSSFKDVLKMVAYVPNASFSLMTSKEQEYDQRAQALKRLAFVVLGSELDQYRTQLPEIQERLAENLRVCQQVPAIRAAVFLCYRVLLLRLQPTNLISMWPIMVTELVHVLLQVEQTIAGATSTDELTSSRDDHWMQLYLAACKLLESLCTLPAGYLAHFQMCHWAFVSTVSTSITVSSNSSDVFVPFAGRIHSLLTEKYGPLSALEISTGSASLCAMKLLTGFDELRPFFHALANANQAHALHGAVGELRESSILSGSLSHRSAMQRLEQALYVDFAEHWQL